MRVSQYRLLALLSFSLPFQIFAGNCLGRLKGPVAAKLQAEQSQYPLYNQAVREKITQSTPLALPLASIVAEYAFYIRQQKKCTSSAGAINRLVALNPTRVASVSAKAELCVHDAEQEGSQAQPIYKCTPAGRYDWCQHYECVQIAPLCPDEFMYSGGRRDSFLRVRNTNDSKKDREIKTSFPVWALTVLASNRVALINHRVEIWNTQTGTLLCKFNTGASGIQGVFAMPHNRLFIASGSCTNTWRGNMYDCATGNLQWGHSIEEIIQHVIKLPDNDILFVARRRGGHPRPSETVIHRIDSQTGKARAIKKSYFAQTHYFDGTNLCFSIGVWSAQLVSNGHVALGLDNGSVMIIDPIKFDQIGVLPTHAMEIVCLANIKNILISGSGDGSIALRNILNNKLIAKLTHHAPQSPAQAIEASSVTATSKTQPNTQESAAAHCADAVAKQPQITALAALADNRFASSDDQGTVIIWEFELCEESGK